MLLIMSNIKKKEVSVFPRTSGQTVIPKDKWPDRYPQGQVARPLSPRTSSQTVFITIDSMASKLVICES